MNKANDPFVEEGTTIAHNDGVWVAGGSATDQTNYSTLAYSYDGII